MYSHSLPRELTAAGGALPRAVAVEYQLLRAAVAAHELPGRAWHVIYRVVLEAFAALRALSHAVLEIHQVPVLAVTADVRPP